MSKSCEDRASLELDEFIEKKFKRRPLVIGFTVAVSCFSSGFGTHAALMPPAAIERVLMIHDCPSRVAPGGE